MLSIIQDEDELDRMFLEQPNQRKRRHKDKDKDPYAGSNQGKRKRSSGKDSEPSKTPSASKKTYTSKDTSKEVLMDSEDNATNAYVVNDADQSQDDSKPQTEKFPWFKQPPRPPTPDPE
ncbi:hypothetical protein Tco_1459768 [Tanacetum coccineum]